MPNNTKLALNFERLTENTGFHTNPGFYGKKPETKNELNQINHSQTVTRIIFETQKLKRARESETFNETEGGICTFQI